MEVDHGNCTPHPFTHRHVPGMDRIVRPSRGGVDEILLKDPLAMTKDPEGQETLNRGAGDHVMVSEVTQRPDRLLN